MSVWARAQAAVPMPPKTDLATVSAWPVPKIREIAEKQIKLTKESFEMASEVAWYEGLYVRWKNHQRFGPYLDKIKKTEILMKEGDSAVTDNDKRKSYLDAWQQSRQISEELHKEFSIGNTSYATVAGDVAKDVSHTVTQAKNTIVAGANELGANLASALKWAAGVGLVVLLLRETGKGR